MKASRAPSGQRASRGKQAIKPAYATVLGQAYVGDSASVLSSPAFKPWHGRAQLLLTSPPFPLVTKKRYGNLDGEEYIDWLCDIVSKSLPLLRDNASIVLEMGNAWSRGMPVMSTLPIRALLAIQERLNLNLCQELIWHNPARLPGPAQWVNIERTRLKDTYTRFWWLSPSTRPEANNRRVLQEYGKRMRRLLDDRIPTSGRRPSQHRIGIDGFLSDNGGAIPASVLCFSNTASVDPYLTYCREKALPRHPARMPIALAEFFIQFLTTDHDLVIDPFAGSNVTGRAAEGLGRRWLSIEMSKDYVLGSKGRFTALRMRQAGGREAKAPAEIRSARS